MEIVWRIQMFKYCPVCQKDLEINPLTLMPACFLHGDVVVSDGNVYFKLLRSV